MNSEIHVNWLAHEIQHCSQYASAGGKGPFFAKYALQSAGEIIKRKSINIHDFIPLEQEADRKSDEVIPTSACCSRPAPASTTRFPAWPIG
jgi:hypothetical protein